MIASGKLIGLTWVKTCAGGCSSSEIELFRECWQSGGTHADDDGLMKTDAVRLTDMRLVQFAYTRIAARLMSPRLGCEVVNKEQKKIVVLTNIVFFINGAEGR